jgi:hypothetical protein
VSDVCQCLFFPLAHLTNTHTHTHTHIHTHTYMSVVCQIVRGESTPSIVHVGVKEGLVRGDARVVSKPAERNEELLSQQYTLPDDVVEGEFIQDLPPVKKTKLSKSRGDSVLRVKQLHPVAPNQSMGSGDQFTQWFSVNTVIINPSEKPNSITDVSFEYCDADGDWVELESVVAGSKAGNQYQMSDSAAVNVAPSCQTEVAWQGHVVLTGKPGSTFNLRNRVHHTLPYPLKLRLTLEDLSGAEEVLEMTYYNKPLDLTTKESRLENSFSHADDAVSQFSWVACDDHATQERKEVCILRRNGMTYIRADSSTRTFNQEHYRELAGQARAAGPDVTEFPLEDLCRELHNTRQSIHALYDRDADLIYGFKVHLSTPDQSVTRYIRRPVQPPGETKLICPASVALNDDGVKTLVEVSVVHPERSAKDKVVIAEPDSGADDKPLEWKYIKPQDASVKLPVPTEPGDYVVRYFACESGEIAAEVPLVVAPAQ